MSSPRVLSAEEVIEVQELKRRVAELIPYLRNDFHKHDMHFVRYLRAREHNVDKAEEMFRKNITWRLTQDADSCLLKDVPADFHTLYPAYFCGRDKGGDVVVVLKLGKFDVKKGLDKASREEFLRFAMQSFDYGTDLTTYITTENDYRFQTYVIADLEGLQLRQYLSKEILDLLVDVVRLLVDNYPECLKALRLINVPKIFEIVWALVKPILTARSLSKVGIYGSSKDKWKAKLREEVDPDNLLAEYGGSINYYKKAVYKEGFDVFPKFKVLPEADFVTVQLGAGSKHVESFDLVAGTTLAWNFQTEYYDIGFKVDFDDIEDIVQYARVDSHECLQKGMFVCENSGKYTLTFDNTFSTFTSKTLKYTVKTFT